jgi:hypothetical protein
VSDASDRNLPMAELGTRVAIERAAVGHSPPKGKALTLNGHRNRKRSVEELDRDSDEGHGGTRNPLCYRKSRCWSLFTYRLAADHG